MTAIYLLLFRMGTTGGGAGVVGPYRTVAWQSFVAGSVKADSHLAGAATSQAFVAGSTKADYQ